MQPCKKTPKYSPISKAISNLSPVSPASVPNQKPQEAAATSRFILGANKLFHLSPSLYPYVACRSDARNTCNIRHDCTHVAGSRNNKASAKLERELHGLVISSWFTVHRQVIPGLDRPTGRLKSPVATYRLSDYFSLFLFRVDPFRFDHPFTGGVVAAISTVVQP